VVLKITGHGGQENGRNCQKDQAIAHKCATRMRDGFPHELHSAANHVAITEP
jgi:hypothetical protein